MLCVSYASNATCKDSDFSFESEHGMALPQQALHGTYVNGAGIM